jgi:hypothetical protein
MIAPAQLSGRPYNPFEDNIGCEACHGPAESYRDTHYVVREGETREQRRARNIQDGMTDLKDLESRARLCLGCHTGLDHEIVAAGHPDLAFELYDHSLRQPPHWDYRSASPLAHWAIGQGVALAEGLQDLSEDSDLYMPIKIFESDKCYGCHHKLPYDRWRQVKGHYPTFQTLLNQLRMSSEASDLADRMEILQDIVGSNDPSARESMRTRSAEISGFVAGLVSQVSREISERQRDPHFVSQLVFELTAPLEGENRKLTPEIPSAWVIQNFNQAQQIYWAINALAFDHPVWMSDFDAKATKSLSPVNEALDELWRSGVGYHSTPARKKKFDVNQFNQGLLKVQEAIGESP